jgi:hypothetical protein
MLLGYPRIDANPEIEAETARTNQARAQILMAIERDKLEAEQQQAQARKQSRNAVAGSPLGQLIRVSYER